MNEAKKIEKGCRFMILPHPDFRDGYAFKQGTALEFIGFHSERDACSIIEYDQAWEVEMEDCAVNLCEEYVMLRIDDPEIQKQIEREKELEHA